MSFPFAIKEKLVISAEAPLGADRYIIDVNGEDFSLLHWEGDGPTVLLLHALGFSAGTYTPLAKNLQARGYNVISLDQRGHGQTRAQYDIKKHSWNTLGQDLANILPLSSQPLHLMGHSMGGLIGIYACKTALEKVASLTLLDPTMHGPQFRTFYNILKWTGIWRRVPIIAKPFYRRDHFPSFDEAFAHYRPKRVFAPWSDEFLRSYVLSAIKETENGDVELSCNRKVEGTLFETTPHYIYNDLKKITPPPAMLLWGERSYVISRLSVKLFKKRWPKAKCVSVPAGCHFFPMSHTDYVLYHWESFIKNLAK